ncbi:MAG: iron-sulfur cluster-binding protein [Anaerolineae bacterium]|nr:iron-sulfur cluster-binding protein [Anaerolineae bacterium]
MKVESQNFIALADIALADSQVQQAVRKGTTNAFNNRIKAIYGNGQEHGEKLRQQAAEAKRRALRNLPDLLEQAEQTLTENGFTVLWAEDAEEARQHVLRIAREHEGKRITKSKSMVTEEIALNDALIAAGLDVVETDLGEYILQINDEHPSHIIAPVIHKTKEDVRRIFQEKIDMPYIEESQDMVAFVRKKLREDFLSADMGITGANFIIAETGSLALVMNEGNGRMVTNLRRVHVAVVGIEKVIATLEDYGTLTQILPRSGTGQAMTVYTNIVNGPCHDGGPEHLYVIFLDNGRSRIYANEKYAEALACIRCGACLNACPVYRSVGGHSYGWVYGGPIGAVLTPLYTGLENAKPLPHASSLCGSCKQVCPVDIDLPRMLLDLRYDLVKEKVDNKWQLGLRGWAMGMQSPLLYGVGAKAARMGMKIMGDNLPSVLGNWTDYRDFPDFAPKSFHEMWQDRQKGKLQ